jgi:hypothetical protein
MQILSELRKLVAGMAFITVATFAQAQMVGPNSMRDAAKMPAIPEGKETDIKLYGANGSGVVMGMEALEQMPKAGLVLWLAGNQFFAMDDVIGSFQKHDRAVSVGLITLPPGLLLQAIKAGGWVYEGKQYRGEPDIYASVNIGHLQQLKASAMMDSYMVYMHNELQDHGGAGQSQEDRWRCPTPSTKASCSSTSARCWNGTCVHCQTTTNNWFNRETPERIVANQSDAGMVWKTEVLAAKRGGAPVDAVVLPNEDSLRTEVSYVIGMLTGSNHRDAAEAFLNFLRSPGGQDAYTKFGFVPVSDAELQPRPIP